MQIFGNSSKILKSAQVAPMPVTEPLEQEQLRDGKAIAEAIVSAAKSMGFFVNISNIDDTFFVTCLSHLKQATAGAVPAKKIEFRYSVPSYGEMTGEIVSGCEGGDEAPVRTMFREIIAKAIQAGRIMAFPTESIVNPLSIADPNRYKQLAAQQAQQQLPTQPNVGGLV